MQSNSGEQSLEQLVQSSDVRHIIRDELLYEDSQAFTEQGIIQAYEIENVEENPMGGIIIYLRINGNSEYHMSVFIDKNSENNKLESTGGSISKELRNLIQDKGK